MPTGWVIFFNTDRGFGFIAPEAAASMFLCDETVVRPMRVREVKDAAERARLWTLAVAAYPPYADYQARTERQIPLFVAEQ
jgi:hypothetical protein